MSHKSLLVDYGVIYILKCLKCLAWDFNIVTCITCTKRALSGEFR